jgi:hypothetical protein
VGRKLSLIERALREIDESQIGYIQKPPQRPEIQADGDPYRERA